MAQPSLTKKYSNAVLILNMVSFFSKIKKQYVVQTIFVMIFSAVQICQLFGWVDSWPLKRFDMYADYARLRPTYEYNWIGLTDSGDSIALPIEKLFPALSVPSYSRRVYNVLKRTSQNEQDVVQMAAQILGQRFNFLKIDHLSKVRVFKIYNFGTLNSTEKFFLEVNL